MGLIEKSQKLRQSKKSRRSSSENETCYLFLLTYTYFHLLYLSPGLPFVKRLINCPSIEILLGS